jgi:hypothetical protein
MFVIAVAITGFLGGYAVHRQRIFPTSVIESSIDQAKRMWGRRHYLSPIVYKRAGARVVDRNAIASGLTLVTTYWRDFEWRTGAKLIDADGKTLHQWRVDVADIWAQPDKRGDYIHGTHLFPNGDLLLNIEYNGVLRMDACGKIVWRSDFVTHHSIAPNADGNFWISGQRTHRNDAEGRASLEPFKGLQPPVYEGVALLVQPNGKLLEQVSMLGILYANGLQRYLPKISKRRQGDIMHLNDIEALSPSLAADYPLFEAGDIVVSLKYLHLILVMDPKSGKVKWHDGDTLIEQHDPDFIGNGWIAVFDNNTDFTDRGTILGGSRIIALRPHTGEKKVLYPTAASEPFYTSAGGKWQLLGNGNLLIVEAQAGRVVEAAPDGRTVWDWVHEPYDDRLVAEVLEATRYALTPEQVRAWPCSPGK